MNIPRCWEVGAPRETQKICASLIPHFLSYAFLPADCFYVIQEMWLKHFLSSGSHYSKILNPRRCTWEPLIYNPRSEVLMTTWDLWLASKSRLSCGTESLTCEASANPRQLSVQIELTCRDTTLMSAENWLLVLENTPEKSQNKPMTSLFRSSFWPIIYEKPVLPMTNQKYTQIMGFCLNLFKCLNLFNPKKISQMFLVFISCLSPLVFPHQFHKNRQMHF